MLETTRVIANTSTVVDGRSWRSGHTYDVVDTEIDALRPHIAAGVFTVLGDAQEAFEPVPAGDPEIPDFVNPPPPPPPPAQATKPEPQGRR